MLFRSLKNLFSHAVHHLELVPLKQIRRTKTGFISKGPTPQLLLKSHLKTVPSRWAFISYRIDDPESKVFPVLYFDRGKGFTRQRSIQLLPESIEPKTLLIRIPFDTRRIRLDPMREPGPFTLSDVRMDTVGSMRLLLMLGWRSLRKTREARKSMTAAMVGGLYRWVRQGHKAFLEELVQPWKVETLVKFKGEYQHWIRVHDTFTPYHRDLREKEIQAMRRKVLISVLMPVYNTPEKFLRMAIESVRRQTYPHWELCIADDASPLPHVKRVLNEYKALDRRIRIVYRKKNGHISAASNSALKLATGEYVALLDHDDELNEQALYHVAKELNRHKKADILYSDEDKMDEEGNRFDPHFKSDWNPDLFYSQNYLSHLGVFRTELVRQVGGFRVGYEGSQDYDLALRCVASTQPRHIRHIPQVLYHWRAIEGSTALSANEKNYAAGAALKALKDHFQAERNGVAVEFGKWPTTYRVNYPLPENPPLVSLIIPTRDMLKVLKVAVDSILEKTTYPNYEIIIVDNQSKEKQTLRYFESLRSHPRIRVLPYNKPFNFSAINNAAVRKARGDVVGLVNNDIEVINPAWLSEMVSHALRPEIGAVGAKLYYPDGRIQHGGVVLGLGGVAGHAHKYFPRDNPGYFSRLDLIQNYSAVTAACLVVRKKVYLEVKGLNEKNLAVAFNDVDFCLKLMKAGYRNLWTPYAELYHHESISRGPENSRKKLLRFKSEKQYMKDRWNEVLTNDPFYNIHLTREREDFSIGI